MTDPISQFQDAIRAVGLEPPNVIHSGKLYRFPGAGKRKGNTAGWCKLFDDAQGGCFGDWSTGLSENWQSNSERSYSVEERAKFAQRVEVAREQAELELKAQYAKAAEKSVTIWNDAEPADDQHAYLVNKSVKACGARLYEDSLVIPMCSDGKLCSLQFITPGGDKRFLKEGQIAGCYFSIGAIHKAQTLCIAEGFATGATIHQATGYPVAIAFNAGNLESVAQTLRIKFPDLPIIICADDDVEINGNPGIAKAKHAACTTGAKIAIPTFSDQRPEEVSDFNDMASLLGLEAVAKNINSAVYPDQSDVEQDTGWPAPQPLTSKIDPAPYPLDALPDAVRSAIEEVHGFTKAPMPLVTSSALAAMSLAVQAHADVKRADKLHGPSGLFLLTIADSGERKSTCDSFFIQAIREYEAKQADDAKPLIKDHKASMEAWSAKYSGVKEKIKSLAKTGKSTHQHEQQLRDLEHKKPFPPRVPQLIHEDATPEALKWSLAKVWPSGGVVSSEAGLVFGAHGMGKDSVMRNLATLNQLWDGSAITTKRRTTESFTVRGARLTIALQVQEATLRSFLDRSGVLARGTGFLARFLVSWPKSTQGYRPFTEAPETWPALEKFNQRITSILELDVPIDDDGALTPLILPLAPDTKTAWIAFHDAIETDLRSGGELFDVRDIASKTADNAVRIATLFQLFEQGISTAISLSAFEGASRIAAWHLHEARRFYGELALPEDQANALSLENWLLEYCSSHQTNVIPRREIQRNVIPGHLRKKDALDVALAVLLEANRARLIQVDKRKEVYINPALLKGDH